MSRISLAQRVEQHPAAAETAFTRLDDALNLVLPGSDTHARYRVAEQIGLALVVSKVGLANSLNPLFKSTPEKLAFMGSNRWLRPGPWESQETDSELLGREVPEELGRFAAFALAKVNGMTISKRDSSYYPRSIRIAPGTVGFAGGRRIEQSLAATSGLWEVHDHIMTQIYADEVALELKPDTSQRNADDLAAEVEPVLEQVQKIHLPVRAEDIAHADIGYLLLIANHHIVSGRIRSTN